MTTPSDIVRHLKTYVPLFTDRFTEVLPVSGATMGASKIVTITSAAHGRTPGKSVVVTAGTTRNPLSAAVLDGATVQFTTKYDHDLIKPSQPLDDQTLTLDGFGSAWDGVFDIIDVPNRRNFNVDLPTGVTVAPTVDESQYLIEARSLGLVGVQEVATVPTADTFTLDLSAAPSLPVGPVDDLAIISGFRISAAADFQRATKIYTKQSSGDDYLFVIMTDGDVSKDRHTFNDSVASFSRQDMNLLRVLRNFSTVVFIGTESDLSGADAQDLAYSTIYSSLLSALFGYEGDESAIKSGAVPVGDGPAVYNSAYYAHTYDWQMQTALTYQDGFLQTSDVAFRDIVQALKLFNDNDAQLTVNLDLDREVL